MDESARHFRSVIDDDEPVSAVSPSSSRRSIVSPRSPTSSFSQALLSRRSGYQRMPSEGLYETTTRDQHLTLHQLPFVEQEPFRIDGLGITDAGTDKLGFSSRAPVGSNTAMSIRTPDLHDTRAPMSSSSIPISSVRPGTPKWNTSYSAVPLASVTAPGQPDHAGDNEDFDDEKYLRGYSGPPDFCRSDHDVHMHKTDWLCITVYALSIYSTVLSGLWLIVSFVQPRWGHQISSSKGLQPSTATTLAALVAKSIEMSFVAVFISFLGQVLTRRSFIKSKGMTLASMQMRNWVLMPGTLITHVENVPAAAMSILGMLALTATLAATFYTTASDAMVAPKLKFGGWEDRVLKGHVLASYANVDYHKLVCPNLLTSDTEEGPMACMSAQYSGQSFQNLMGFMSKWSDIDKEGTQTLETLSMRPVGTHLLYENTTMTGSWVETGSSNVTALYEKHDRIINNVTLAMPHPGVYEASTHPLNRILQPKDLGNVGEYSVRAGVVSPSINVMCVNMDEEELEPLIYTAWPTGKLDSTRTGVGDQLAAPLGWDASVPPPLNKDGEAEYLNRTNVDDVFKWGPKYGRRPPVFQLYPADFNLLANSTVYESDAIYLLGKTPHNDFTLCEMRSWLSHTCSTHFRISGTAGASMQSHCEDEEDGDAYWRSFPDNQEWARPSPDWKWVGDIWRLSMDLNGGTHNGNASNARMLTQLALTKPELPPNLPSLAEALAVYATSTVVTGSIDTPFVHWWEWPKPILGQPGYLQAFNATIRTQEFTSGHVANWQTIFYLVLLLVFAINLICAVYFFVLYRSGMVTDFTEPQNMFALAVNSPPSTQLKGSCGGGPQKRDLSVPWRVAWAPSANHYFFEETNDMSSREMSSSDAERKSNEPLKTHESTYKRLSSGRGWL